MGHINEIVVQEVEHNSHLNKVPSVFINDVSDQVVIFQVLMDVWSSCVCVAYTHNGVRLVDGVIYHRVYENYDVNDVSTPDNEIFHSDFVCFNFNADYFPFIEIYELYINHHEEIRKITIIKKTVSLIFVSAIICVFISDSYLENKGIYVNF